MVGNEPHLGGRSNSIVGQSPNCCWVNKLESLTMRKGKQYSDKESVVLFFSVQYVVFKLQYS